MPTMAATRTYIRGSNGRFAGSRSGGKTTTGRSGGFHNSSFRARVANGKKVGKTRPASSQKQRHHTKRRLTTAQKRKIAAVAGTAAGIGAAGLAARAASRRKSSTYRNKGVGRREVVSMPKSKLGGSGVHNGRSVRTGAFVAGAAKSATRAAARPSTPRRSTVNYSNAVGRKEHVGRRVTDGNYGFVLKKG